MKSKLLDNGNPILAEVKDITILELNPSMKELLLVI